MSHNNLQPRKFPLNNLLPLDQGLVLVDLQEQGALKSAVRVVHRTLSSHVHVEFGACHL
jgi:hypothetical protein